MDISLISAALGAQTGALQTQMAAKILKSNMNMQRDTVLTLLNAGQESAASLANVASGVGGNVNISA